MPPAGVPRRAAIHLGLPAIHAVPARQFMTACRQFIRTFSSPQGEDLERSRDGFSFPSRRLRHIALRPAQHIASLDISRPWTYRAQRFSAYCFLQKGKKDNALSFFRSPLRPTPYSSVGTAFSRLTPSRSLAPPRKKAYAFCTIFLPFVLGEMLNLALRLR